MAEVDKNAVCYVPFLPFIEWHNWLYLGLTQIVLPKLGPFDPRDDSDRKGTREKYICVDCGEEKLKEPESFVF